VESLLQFTQYQGMYCKDHFINLKVSHLMSITMTEVFFIQRLSHGQPQSFKSTHPELGLHWGRNQLLSSMIIRVFIVKTTFTSVRGFITIKFTDTYCILVGIRY